MGWGSVVVRCDVAGAKAWAVGEESVAAIAAVEKRRPPTEVMVSMLWST